MKLLAYLFRVYLKTSIHIALAVSSLLYITLKSHQLNYSESLYEFAFFGSVISYNFIKYGLEVKRYVINSKAVMIPLVIISLVSAVMALRALLEFSFNQLILILGFGILIYLYTIPFIPSWPNFRNLSRIKIYIVALVWSGITVLLPLIDQPLDGLFLEFIQGFVFVLVLMIPFEIRDLQYDDASLKTLAQSFGVRGVKRLGVFLLVVWLGLSLYLELVPLPLVFLIGLLLALALSLVKRNSKRVFTEFWVESIPIVYALAYYFFLNM